MHKFSPIYSLQSNILGNYVITKLNIKMKNNFSSKIYKINQRLLGKPP